MPGKMDISSTHKNKQKNQICQRINDHSYDIEFLLNKLWQFQMALKTEFEQ